MTLPFLKAYFPVVIWSAFLLSRVLKAQDLPPVEINALQDLFIATHGDSWYWTSRTVYWNFSGNPVPCFEKWYGVQCSASPVNGSLRLESLKLASFNLNGTVPASTGTLSFLTYLDLSSNHLTGDIPNVLGDLKELQVLHLNNNFLNGTVPVSLGSLSALTDIRLSVNYLTGTVPPELANDSALKVLYINTNRLNGTIPASLGQLSSLTQLKLHINFLTGTIPPELSEASNLQVLSIYQNFLRGTIPTALGLLVALTDMRLSINGLTGTIPTELANAKGLKVLYLNDNFLHGTIPSNLGTLLSAQSLKLSNNSLTGTAPASFSNLTQLEKLTLFSNRLTGCLPDLRALRNLEVLDAQDNRFQCALDGVFNASMDNLLEVQLGMNHFTGQLPAELFLMKRLATLVADSNCFTGTLPDTICNAVQLQSLILDGLHAAHSCKTTQLIFMQTGKLVVPPRFYGTLPACVFSFPALTILRLSGNELSGSIPASNVTLGRNLTQLYLSHNSLTGSIPEYIQAHAWYEIDLSYNRLGGTLNGTFGAQLRSNTSILHLKNNRLSGRIPSATLDLQDVNLLGTNLFDCRADKKDIPAQDSERRKYQCGSDAFNSAIYAFVAVAALIVVCCALARYYGSSINVIRPIADAITSWMLPKGSLPRSCQQVFTMVEILCQVAVYSTVLIALVLVPWYAAASTVWGSYTYQYAWMVSAAFMSGFTPGVIELLLQSSLILAMALITIWITLRTERDEAAFADRRPSALSAEPVRTLPAAVRAKGYAMFLVVNITVVVTMNVAFIYAVLNATNTAQLRTAQLALPLFKSLWNTVCVPRLIAVIAWYVMPVVEGCGFFRVQSFVGLFNNIAIPCLVVAAQSPSCFYNWLVPSQDVTSTYLVHGCAYTDASHTTLDCTKDLSAPQESSYRPNFAYSYECSSSLITYYAAPFIYFAIAPIVITPALHCALVWTVRKTAPGSALNRLAFWALPPLWRDVEQVGSEHQPPAIRRGGNYLKASNLLVAINIYLGILLTFGVAFPPVAVAMCAAILSVAWQTKLGVGRLLVAARAAQRQDMIDALEQDCKGVASLQKLRSIILMSIAFGGIFYAIFIFDTIGDAEGAKNAYWVLILTPLFPASVYGYVRLRRLLAEKGGAIRQLGFSMDGRALEMTVLAGKHGTIEEAGSSDESGSTLNTLHGQDEA